MTHLRPITHIAPAPAASLLQKAVFIENLAGFTAALQELSDLFTKSDTHDNR